MIVATGTTQRNQEVPGVEKNAESTKKHRARKRAEHKQHPSWICQKIQRRSSGQVYRLTQVLSKTVPHM